MHVTAVIIMTITVQAQAAKLIHGVTTGVVSTIMAIQTHTVREEHVIHKHAQKATQVLISALEICYRLSIGTPTATQNGGIINTVTMDVLTINVIQHQQLQQLQHRINAHGYPSVRHQVLLAIG
jgi:hypothetical protein